MACRWPQGLYRRDSTHAALTLHIRVPDQTLAGGKAGAVIGATAEVKRAVWKLAHMRVDTLLARIECGADIGYTPARVCFTIDKSIPVTVQLPVFGHLLSDSCQSVRSSH